MIQLGLFDAYLGVWAKDIVSTLQKRVASGSLRDLQPLVYPVVELVFDPALNRATVELPLRDGSLDVHLHLLQDLLDGEVGVVQAFSTDELVHLIFLVCELAW